MKSKIVRHEEKKEIEYPCLMESKGMKVVVLMRMVMAGGRLGNGVVVNTWGNIPFGDYSSNWGLDDFTPFHGEIILSNGE